MAKISPFLWFDKDAEAAAKLYTSLFKSGKITSTSHYTKEGAEAAGQPEGAVMTVAFELDGESFTAINGGPVFHFTEAISFVITCELQEEIDHFWDGLTADGGKPGQCGWLKDKFGVSWQVVPKQLGELMSDPDPAKAGRVMGTMLTMTKIIIADLENAAQGS